MRKHFPFSTHDVTSERSHNKSYLTASFLCLLEMGIQFEMCLRLATKNLHFILVETFITAELQLCSAVIEVDVADSIPDALAEVACLCTLEGCPAP